MAHERMDLDPGVSEDSGVRSQGQGLGMASENGSGALVFLENMPMSYFFSCTTS